MFAPTRISTTLITRLPLAFNYALFCMRGQPPHPSRNNQYSPERLIQPSGAQHEL